MDTQTRDLHYQILAAVAEVEGTPLVADETFVLQVTSVLSEMTGMQAIHGMTVEAGLTDVPVQSGVYLTRTIHRRGEKNIAIYNTCVMDAAGDIRLVKEMRVDARHKDFVNQVRIPLGKLITEHEHLNNPRQTSGYQLMGALNQAANLIEVRPTESWAGSITYLLETLKNSTNPLSYTEFLEALHQDIDTWLTTGMW